MTGQRHPLYQLKPDDRGPAVIVVSYTLSSVSVAFTIVRFWLDNHRQIAFKLDDAAYTFAIIFGIASAALINVAVINGLGRHRSSLSDVQLEAFSKAIYAAQLLGLAAMASAKMSVAMLLGRIIPDYRNSASVSFSAIAGWALFSLFAVAFGCSLPRPWDLLFSQCSTSGGKLLYPVIIFNILTDVMLSFWVLPYISTPTMKVKKRVLVCSLFGARLTVLFPAIAQLVLLSGYLRSPDKTWASYSFALCNQTTVFVSILCAALPRTNHFLSGLAQGQFSTEVPNFQIEQSGSGAAPLVREQTNSVRQQTPAQTEAQGQSRVPDQSFSPVELTDTYPSIDSGSSKDQSIPPPSERS